jgi:RNA polymerase sigma factor (sigma-70 family)
MTEEEFKNNILPFSRKLYPMLKGILKDEEETRDALQELMLKLWRNRNELDKCHNQPAYIIAMAKNYSFDVLKKKRPLRIDEKGNPQYLNLEANETSPDVVEKYEHVQKVIASLPEKYREVIRLRDIDGFSYEEIQEFTGLEITNIRVVLSRARQKVKEEVKKIYDYEDKRQIVGKLL